jgi:ketosteroid isomerase-like protein
VRIRSCLFPLLFASGALAAAQTKPTGPVAAIRAADQEWNRVFGAKDLEKSVAACSDSASVLAPNAPRATGREAIRRLFEGFFALPELEIAWTPSDVQVAKSGDLGFSTGAYRMRFQDSSGKTVEDHGKYVTVWEKDPDGTWRVLVDAFNSDLPAAAPPK